MGPLQLSVREALVARSKAVDTLKHGERVEVLAQRRSFYLIRTKRGHEGWVDGRQLLAAQEMEALRRLAERAATAPSQGAATVLDPLNVHTAPFRQAPSFRQIRPEERVDVIAYERVPRKPYVPQPLLTLKTAAANRKAQPRKKQDAQAEPLRKPAAPGLPSNWMELSRTAPPDEEKPAQPPPVPTDEWALVRCKDGSAGWVLARMLYMSIPDEVAQYAERARIMAYFQIGSVRAKNENKPVWLWAAQSQRSADYDFDSLRIFVWSTKRGRWETAFIERGLKGRLPIELRHGKTGITGFDAIVEDKGGRAMKRHYAWQDGVYRARIASKEEAPRAKPWWEAAPEPQQPQEEAGPPPGLTAWLRRWMEAVRGTFSR